MLKGEGGGNLHAQLCNHPIEHNLDLKKSRLNKKSE